MCTLAVCVPLSPVGGGPAMCVAVGGAVGEENKTGHSEQL